MRRRRVEAEFSEEIVVKQTMEVYEKRIRRLPRYDFPNLRGKRRLRRKNEKVRYPFPLKAYLGKV
jgi:hypothetical protein